VAYALSSYPPSADFRARFERSLGVPAAYFNLPQLSRLPRWEMFRALRSLAGNPCFLLLEDETTRALLPILETLTTLARARPIEVVDAELRREAVPMRRAIASLAALGAASVRGQLALRARRRELEGLLRAPRSEADLGTDRRVLYLNSNLWFGLKAGGSVGHIAGVVNGFLDAGHEVDLVTSVEQALIRPEVRIVPLHMPPSWGLPLESNYFRLQPVVVQSTCEIARTRTPGFLYQRMSLDNFAGVVASRALSLPLILEYNGSEAWIARHWGRKLRYAALAEQAEEVCLRHAHIVVTVSKVLRDELVERGVPAERIVCYPNCVDPTLFDPSRFTPAARNEVRQRHGIAANATVVTFVGTFGQWHGVEVLSRAIARLVAGDESWLRRKRVRFMLVGNGLKMPEVEAILARACASGYAVLTGLVPQGEAPRYLAASDILVSPHVPNADGTRFFGSPTKLFEYMAMGKAILASDLDQLGDVLHDSLRASAPPVQDPVESDSQLALLATPGSVDELVRGIRFLVERPAWRAHLGGRVRELVLSHYTWRHHVDAIIAVASTVLGGRKHIRYSDIED
jgi:glycosyltransferase involved in cell wall biosynthesis